MHPIIDEFLRRTKEVETDEIIILWTAKVSGGMQSSVGCVTTLHADRHVIGTIDAFKRQLTQTSLVEELEKRLTLAKEKKIEN
jgi:ABC-type taurine transport system ATPase subunit